MDRHLSDTEEYLWHYIQKNRTLISDLSIIKLSELASVSPSTIVRTMKKQGFNGYTDFKYYLKEEENATIYFDSVEKVDKEIRLSILKNEQEVIRTIQSLNTGLIEDAIQRIHHANRILIFARGLSELIAQEMMMKFQLIDKYCEFHSDPNIIKIRSQNFEKTDFVIFISLSGNTPELVCAAKNCYTHDIGTLLISTNPSSSLSTLCELSLLGFKSDVSLFPDYEVRSRLPLSVIARILLDAYVIRMKNK